MKVVVINSPLFRDRNDRYDEDSLPPIGLGLIATSLKNWGVDVQLIDAVAARMPLKYLVASVIDIAPEFICTNVFTTNLELVKEFIELYPLKAHFIVGGLSTQDLQSQIFNWKTRNTIDIVHGDGELIVPAIVLKALQEEPAVEIPQRRFFKVDNNSCYFVRNISVELLDRSFFINEPTLHPFGFKEANIITSRGCIYDCAFCAAATSLNREFGTREKDAGSVIDEIRQLQKIYPGLESIRVLDDLFLKNRNTVRKAIEVFRNFDLKWRSMAHVQTFRGIGEDIIKELKASGCDELFIGIESGSPRVLKQIKKTSDVDLIKENLSLLLRNGINIKGYFIYGFPGETLEDFELTYELAKHFKDVSLRHGSRFRTSVFQFRPYHGTALYHSLENELGKNTFDRVAAVEPNEELSNLVGRLQYNFHSGNYSNESIEVVRSFIYKTTNLAPARIYNIDDEHTEYYNQNKAV